MQWRAIFRFSSEPTLQQGDLKRWDVGSESSCSVHTPGRAAPMHVVSESSFSVHPPGRAAPVPGRYSLLACSITSTLRMSNKARREESLGDDMQASRICGSTNAERARNVGSTSINVLEAALV